MAINEEEIRRKAYILQQQAIKATVDKFRKSVKEWIPEIRMSIGVGIENYIKTIGPRLGNKETYDMSETWEAAVYKPRTRTMKDGSKKIRPTIDSGQRYFNPSKDKDPSKGSGKRIFDAFRDMRPTFRWLGDGLSFEINIPRPYVPGDQMGPTPYGGLLGIFSPKGHISPGQRSPKANIAQIAFYDDILDGSREKIRSIIHTAVRRVAKRKALELAEELRMVMSEYSRSAYRTTEVRIAESEEVDILAKTTISDGTSKAEEDELAALIAEQMIDEEDFKK